MAADNYPEQYLPVLIDVYERGDAGMRTDSRHILQGVFSGLSTERKDVESLLPVLKTNLQSSDALIRSQILVYLGRCGPNAKAALPEVIKRLSDKDAVVRSEATNTLKAIRLTR